MFLYISYAMKFKCLQYLTQFIDLKNVIAVITAQHCFLLARKYFKELN